jgi:hypothetical protein
MKKTSLGLALLFSTVAFAASPGKAETEMPLAYDIKKIKINEGIKLISGATFDVESPAISNNGDRLCYIDKLKDSKIIYPVEIYTMELGRNGKWGNKRRIQKEKKFDAFSKCAFDENDDILASELKYRFWSFSMTRSLWHSIRNGDFEPKGYDSYITSYRFSDLEKTNTIKPKEMGFSSDKEFIKHPRVSPDGNWMTYYTMGMHDKKGAFLYNLNTKKTYRLSYSSDKHPTWTADGKKILFHFQQNIGENQVEAAYLGYYELNLTDKNVISYKRVVMDDLKAEGYTYHKHPALDTDSNLLFFHGQKKHEGKKVLMVRRLEKDSQVYELKMKINGMKLKKAKHPTIGFTNTGVVFVGKKDIEGEKYKIYQLTPEAVDFINSKMK